MQSLWRLARPDWLNRSSSLACCLSVGMLLSWIMLGSAQAQGTLVTYVRTSDDSMINQMMIKENTIIDYRLNLFDNGQNPFSFVTVEFKVNADGKYFFGQQEAPMDTVMLLYKGSFNPQSVRTNLVAANDDWYRFDNYKLSTYNTRTPSATCATENYNCIKLYSDITLVLKKCGLWTRFCPGMYAELEANTKYYMVVTHFNSSERAQFQLPQAFWCYGGSCTLRIQVTPPPANTDTPVPNTNPTTPDPAQTPNVTPTPTQGNQTNSTPKSEIDPPDPDPLPPTPLKANVDPVPTFLSLVTQERGLAQMMSQQASRLLGAVENDCAQFDERGYCMSFRIRANFSGAAQEGAGIFILSKQVGPQLRVGIFADHVVTAQDPAGFQIKDQRPAFGGFVGYMQNSAGEGYHAKLSVAYHSGLLTSTREVILTSEAGSGTSSLVGYAVRGETAYTSIFANLLVTPFVAVRHLQVIRDGYTEVSVDMPLSFREARLNLTSAIGGVRIEGRLTSRIGYQASVSGEYDALRRITAMSGTSTIEKLETFGIQRSFNKDPVRLSAMGGIFWEFGKANRLFAQTSVRGNPQAVGAITTLVGYQISF